MLVNILWRRNNGTVCAMDIIILLLLRLFLFRYISENGGRWYNYTFQLICLRLYIYNQNPLTW